MAPQPITPAFIGPRFPTFYAECAYLDGARDAEAGTDRNRESYMRHGQTEPKGMRWYCAGTQA